MGKAISSQAELVSKRCSKCRKTKPADDFVFRDSKKRYSSRCRACIAKGNRAYYLAHRKRLIRQAAAFYHKNKKRPSYVRWRIEYARRRHREHKAAALAIYGEHCVCCGESQFEFLTLDHIKNDGHLHRAEINGSNFYWWLTKKNGRKKDERLQTLCFNCNFGKRYNGGVCPHKHEGSETRAQARRDHAIPKRRAPRERVKI